MCTAISFQTKDHYFGRNLDFTTAFDIGIMSCELLKHEGIKKYSTVWMDSLRDGKSELVNTNKLIRFYEGAIGVKTGSTSKAKYCLSSAATRNGLTLIGVVIGTETTANRFETAKALLNYGFSNYKISTLINLSNSPLDDNTLLTTLGDISVSECKDILESNGNFTIKSNGNLDLINGIEPSDPTD